jgi:hypothetical protein
MCAVIEDVLKRVGEDVRRHVEQSAQFGSDFDGALKQPFSWLRWFECKPRPKAAKQHFTADGSGTFWL